MTTALAAPSPKSRRGWKIAVGCLLAVALLCGGCALYYGLAFRRAIRAAPEVARRVRAETVPGATLSDVLQRAYIASSAEPAASLGPAVARLWAECTRGEGGRVNVDRVWLFSPQDVTARRRAATLPATVVVGDAFGGRTAPTSEAIRDLSRCGEVEIVFEAPFAGWVHLPIALDRSGRVATVGEIRSVAK